MVNIKWDVYNMVTIWLMVALLFVMVGFGKSLISNVGKSA